MLDSNIYVGRSIADERHQTIMAGWSCHINCSDRLYSDSWQSFFWDLFVSISFSPDCYINWWTILELYLDRLNVWIGPQSVDQSYFQGTIFTFCPETQKHLQRWATTATTKPFPILVLVPWKLVHVSEIFHIFFVCHGCFQLIISFKITTLLITPFMPSCLNCRKHIWRLSN